MNTAQKMIFFFFFCLTALILFIASAYRITEVEQAIITQFGKPVGLAVTEAGLHFKKPFIQEVRRLDKRILNWDGYENQIPTKDKKYIWVDTTARWRIVDPLLFIKSVQTENNARKRLDAILDAATRDTISNHNLVEAVRNSNDILKKLDDMSKAQKETPGEEGKVVGEIASIKVGREKLSEIIIKQTREKTIKDLGIEIIDVQLRRIAYEAGVERKVYERMISERESIAEKIRSKGKAEKAKIKGNINKRLQKIESAAYSTAEKIKGRAEAKAIRIYAGAMNADPEFYKFIRTLEAYKKAIPGETNLILSTENKFLELLRKK